MDNFQSSYLPSDMEPPIPVTAPCEYDELLLLIHTRMMHISDELQTFLERCFGSLDLQDESGHC